MGEKEVMAQIRARQERMLGTVERKERKGIPFIRIVLLILCLLGAAYLASHYELVHWK